MKQPATRLFLALALPLLLSSCIGIDADARVGSDGSVDLSMTYTVSSAVDELGRLGSNAAYLPLPVGRDDLELAATRAGGQLRSWTRKDGDDSFVVVADLRFPSVAAFASFLDPAGELAVFAEAGGASTLTLRLSAGQKPADPDLAEFIRLAFADYMISIRIELPRTPSTSQGFAVSGKVASFSMKAADLYAAETPVSASVSW